MSPVLAALLLSVASFAENGAAVTLPPSPQAPEVPIAQPAARILPLDARMEAYDQFRSFFETARYQDALPFAKRVVELSEADPTREYELPIAYNNLAATQYQLGEYAAAEASYKRSLEILESSQGISSRRLIVPLAGLGAVYAALDQHGMATERLERALAVSRRSEGLFNLAQLPLIEQAVSSRLAIGDFSGVERERLYALKIAEQNYGYGDPRTLPPTMRLAAFYEEMEEFIPARVFYLRARDITMQESGGFNPATVRALVSICRTHRMQYTMDPDSLDDDVPIRDPITGELVGRMYRSTRVPAPAANRAGLKSAEKALELLRAASDPPVELLVETLVELGDWFQATARPNTAIPYYTEASNILARNADSGLANPLLAPRMIFYRAPQGAKRGVLTMVAGDVPVRSTIFSFEVTADGNTEKISVVSTNMREGQLAQARRAIARAVYSPRFENGKPLPTTDVRFTSEWYEDSSTGGTGAVPAAEPAAQPEKAEPEKNPATEPARPAEPSPPPASAAGS